MQVHLAGASLTTEWPTARCARRTHIVNKCKASAACQLNRATPHSRAVGQVHEHVLPLCPYRTVNAAGDRILPGVSPCAQSAFDHVLRRIYLCLVLIATAPSCQAYMGQRLFCVRMHACHVWRLFITCFSSVMCCLTFLHTLALLYLCFGWLCVIASPRFT